MNESEKQKKLALWRYSLLSPLLHKDPDGKTIREQLSEIASAKYRHPNDNRFLTVDDETIRKWLYRYRQSGLSGLEDQRRSTLGTTTVSEKIQNAIRDLREQHPRWTLRLIFNEILEQENWNGESPSESALYRFCTSNNLQRDPHKQKPDSFQSFEYSNFGQLWIADFMDGPKLWNNKQKRKTHLHVILDDACRLVVEGHFYFAENTQILITDLRSAIRRYGIPERFYSDNGAAYKSRHLEIITARMGVQNIHTPSRRPQGRGNEKSVIMRSWFGKPAVLQIFFQTNFPLYSPLFTQVF